MSSKKVEFLWVDSDKALDYFVTNLRGYFPIALDTEADSLHHYRESVCLIQVTHDSRHFLIDPLGKFPLDELWPPTSRHTWILHGADFDLRMLRRAGAPEPQAVFDTMLAAQLLGLKAFGYGALVEKFCGITLNKGSQKADWSRRPLSILKARFSGAVRCLVKRRARNMVTTWRSSGLNLTRTSSR